MTNEFVAFWCGGCAGVIVGFVLAAVFVAVSNKIEGSEEK